MAKAEPLSYAQWRAAAEVDTAERIHGQPPVVRPAFCFPPYRRWPQMVYRLWDEAGRLLYVGWTEHFGVRMYMHRDRAPWWPEIASYQVDTFATRCAASVAERSGILNESPIHNVRRPAAGWSAPCLIDELRSLPAGRGETAALTPMVGRDRLEEEQ